MRQAETSSLIGDVNMAATGSKPESRTSVEKKQELRKNDVADAALRVIARDGLDGASMRAIAHEMGKSTGVLTHYFRDKESLLLFTIEAVSLGVNEALDPLFETKLTPESFTRALEALVHNDDGTDIYWRAWLAMTTASMRGASIHAAQARSYQNYRDAIADRIKALQEGGWLSEKADPVDLAIKTIAFIDGIGIQSIISPEVLPPSSRSAFVRSYCDSLFSSKGF